MSKTNCINCGAAKETSELQCPFCGTKYTDLTTIDLMHTDKIFIQLNSGGRIITAKAYITERELKFNHPYIECRNMSGQLHRISSGMNISGTIGFTLFENNLEESKNE